MGVHHTTPHIHRVRKHTRTHTPCICLCNSTAACLCVTSSWIMYKELNLNLWCYSVYPLPSCTMDLDSHTKEVANKMMQKKTIPTLTGTQTDGQTVTQKSIDNDGDCRNDLIPFRAAEQLSSHFCIILSPAVNSTLFALALIKFKFSFIRGRTSVCVLASSG